MKKRSNKAAAKRVSNQQSIPRFSESEQELIDAAMEIECIRTQGVWVHRAALMHAKSVIANDSGNTQRVLRHLQQQQPGN